MQSVESTFSATIEVNRSKFIAHLVPMAASKGLQTELKHTHPKANHVVYALRYLNEHDQIVENFSDDGEPKGCAGMPCLNVLRGEAMINCAVLIVRYFGGIKLGTGGMARAYAKAVQNVLCEATLCPHTKQKKYAFVSLYSEVDMIMYHLERLGITNYSRVFGIGEVEWVIEADEVKIDAYIATG